MASPASPQISTASPSHLSMVLDKHLTTLVHCLQNVVYVVMLVHFLELGMFWICFAASKVSPVDSWKGFAYNLWFCGLVCGMMLAFKGTLEYLICFENLRRNKDGNKETTTTISVVKAGVQIAHVDNGSTNTTWKTLACFILDRFMNKAAQNEVETKPDTTPTSTTEDEIKEAPADDDIKQDAASASSSARSTAETSEMLN